MYVHDSIKVDKVDTSCSNILSLCLPEYKVHVVTVYRSLSQTTAGNQVMLDYLLNYSVEKEVIMLGYFNLPSLLWDGGDAVGQVTATDKTCLDAFVSLGLTQWVHEPTSLDPTTYWISS